MLLDAFGIISILVLGLSMIGLVFMIGQQRKPLGPGAAVLSLVLNGFMILTILGLMNR